MPQQRPNGKYKEHSLGATVKAAEVRLAGEGWSIEQTETHPAGRLFSGGYDSNENTIYLGSVIGHPRGVSVTGGDPSREGVSGMRVLVTDGGGIYWATDSMSLPRGVTKAEEESIQSGLESHFEGRIVNRVENFEGIQD